MKKDIKSKKFEHMFFTIFFIIKFLRNCSFVQHILLLFCSWVIRLVHTVDYLYFDISNLLTPKTVFGTHVHSLTRNHFVFQF